MVWLKAYNCSILPTLPLFESGGIEFQYLALSDSEKKLLSSYGIPERVILQHIVKKKRLVSSLFVALVHQSVFVLNL